MQRQDTRRTLDELRVLHTRLEPALRDFYTESRRDARFYSWLLRNAGISVSAVYAIDDRLVVGSTEVETAGGEVGPRGRLIGLAASAATWETSEPTVTCVIDADWDLLFDGPEYPDLLRTDGGSVEVYAFTQAPLQHFFDLVLAQDYDADDLIARMTPLLNDLYLLRAVLHRLGPGYPVIDGYIACCSCCGMPWTVDLRELLRRCLAVRGDLGRLDEMMTAVEEVRRSLPTNRRLAIRGHDIAPVLVKGLNLRNEWAHRDVVERSLVGCLQFSDIEHSELTVALRARFS